MKIRPAPFIAVYKYWIMKSYLIIEGVISLDRCWKEAKNLFQKSYFIMVLVGNIHIVRSRVKGFFAKGWLNLVHIVDVYYWLIIIVMQLNFILNEQWSTAIKTLKYLEKILYITIMSEGKGGQEGTGLINRGMFEFQICTQCRRYINSSVKCCTFVLATLTLSLKSTPNFTPQTLLLQHQIGSSGLWWN